MPSEYHSEDTRMVHDPLPDVQRIAVLRPNAVGDFVFALPCLHALKATYPGAHLVYLGASWHAAFLTDRPSPIDEVMVLPPCPGVSSSSDARVDETALEHFIDRLREIKFDLALQIFGGGRYANPFIRQLDARLTVGMKSTEAEALDRWVHYGPLQNRRLQLLEVAALAGARQLSMGPELKVTNRDRCEAESVLPRTPHEHLVILQPGSSDSRRCWPAARFAEVGDRLAQRGALVAVNGTAREAEVVRAVMDRMRYPAVDLTGKLSLGGLCGLLERSALLVSNDTGPLHLAIAIDTPSIGIYWLSNLLESGPLRQHVHRPFLSTRIHCPLCGAENLSYRCPHDVSFLDDVPVEAVAEAAIALFEQSCC